MSRVDRHRRRYVRGVGLVLGLPVIAGCNGDAGPDGEDGGMGTDETEGGDTDDEEDQENADDDGTENREIEDETDDESESGPRDVTIQSSAGEVSGTLYGTGACAVVLTPQINLDRGSWEPQASRWAEEYLVLTIDPVEEETPASVVGAIDHLREEENVETIVLVGASIGGEASVVAAAERRDVVSGVVALSPGGGQERADELTGEKLFVVAEDDNTRFVEATEALHERASNPKELVTYEGSAHGQGLFDTEHAEDLLDGIDELLAAACE